MVCILLSTCRTPCQLRALLSLPCHFPVWSCLLVCPCLFVSYSNSISQEAERLKHENEELRKLGEDAVLDQQLSKALQETDKLKLAADAYKKELLQQKVGELQAELAQTTKRLKVAEEEKSGVWKSLHMAFAVVCAKDACMSEQCKSWHAANLTLTQTTCPHCML